MSNTVISVENISKSYQLGTIGTGTFYGDVKRWWARQRGKPDPYLKIGETDYGDRNGETVWALKDINFTIQQGEAVGIIGSNGSGKSTLLKIISQVTAPTSGIVKAKGRVASLLEVGTGFHPELTGRENIFLNGAILGMNQQEIAGKLDEIVDFSGVEKFIDTPVKRYSSGMYVRLAFAVAAHLEAEILIVDEVLAVGDAEFQKKCLGKMGDVAHGGRTVLFVSHSMGAVNLLCSRCILLGQGHLKHIGEPVEVINSYMEPGADDQHSSSIDLVNYMKRSGPQDVRFEWAQLRNSKNVACRQFSIGEDLIVTFGMRSLGIYTNKRVKVAVQLRTSDGLQLCNMIDVDSGFQIENLKEFEVVSVRLKDMRFYPGTYYVSLWVGGVTASDTFDWVQDCLSFEIKDGGSLTARHLPRHAGILFLTPDWALVEDTSAPIEIQTK